MLDGISTDPEALRKSIDRGQAALNCYLRLLSIIPNSTSTVLYSNEVSLADQLNKWRGDWSMFIDHTEDIVPYEAKFVEFRKWYADQGMDLTNVPYMVLQDNKMNPPDIITDAEAKARFSPIIQNPLPQPTDPGPSMDMTSKAIMLGLGAAVSYVLYKIIPQPKRRTVGARQAWRIDGRDFLTYTEAMRWRKKTGSNSDIEPITHYLK